MPTGTSTDIRLVPVSRLKVDHRYQRRLDERWVLHLVDNWQDDLAGVLLVSSRDDGDLVVLNGQHRLAAIRKLIADHADVTESMWAEVYFGLTPEQEAGKFMGRNDQKPLHKLDQFRARIVAGEPLAVRINNILLDNGVTWDYDSRRGYACVGLLEKIAAWGVLPDTVRILEQAWPNGAFAASKRRRQIVEGMGIFLSIAKSRDGYSDETAIDRFGSRVNVTRLLQDARNESLTSSVNQSVVVARRLRDAYNRNAKKRLPEIIPPRGYRG